MVLYEITSKIKALICCNIIKCFKEFKLFLKSFDSEVYLQFGAFLPCYFILSFKLNKSFDDIASKQFTFQSFFI